LLKYFAERVIFRLIQEDITILSKVTGFANNISLAMMKQKFNHEEIEV
jgi:hypothetical protein